MKTKEIDVWLVGQGVNYEVDYVLLLSEDEGNYYMEEGDQIIKCRLTIPLPDKKVEITETDLAKACETAGVGSHQFKYMKEALGLNE